MWVGEIDVHEDAQVRAFWEAGKEGDEYGRPYALSRSLEATTVALREPSKSQDIVVVAATEDGDVRGIGELMAPLLDNTHVVYMETIVRPTHRGRGVGSMLLEALLQRARDRGRTTAIAEVNMPFESSPESAGSKFLERHGFTTASLDIHRVLDLPVDSDHLDTLERQAAAYHGDYRLASFRDRVPDEFMEGYCALQSTFNAQAPLGDLDLEPEVWDESRVRQGEARGEQMGRRTQGTVAISDSGDLVALTEMGTNRHQPEVGWQSGTLVLPGHRGHRLGLATKVANQRRFQEAFPAVRMVHSWNAEANGPMVAINDTIGFRPVEYLAEMQRKL